MKNKDQILLEAAYDETNKVPFGAKTEGPAPEGAFGQTPQTFGGKTLSLTDDEISVLFELLNSVIDMIPPIGVEDDNGEDMNEDKIEQIVDSIHKKLSKL